MSNDGKPSPLLSLATLVFLLASGGLAVSVLLKPEKPSPPASAELAQAFAAGRAGREEQARPEAEPPGLGGAGAQKSTPAATAADLPPARREAPPESESGPIAPEPGEAEPAPEAAAPARSAEAEPRADPAPGLSGQEDRLLDRALGRLGVDSVEELGSTSLLFRIGWGLRDHPRLLSYILNNGAVARGFRAQPWVRRYCSSPDALQQYLGNSSDPRGVQVVVRGARIALREGVADEVVGSKTAQELLANCPSVERVVRDPSRVGQVAQDNPDLLALLTDPATPQALLASRPALQVFSGAQSSLAGGGMAGIAGRR